MPLSRQDPANEVNEQVTVEMLVKAAKNGKHCSQVFLDSEEDHHDPKNLAVAVTETGKGRFRELKIEDAAYEVPLLWISGRDLLGRGSERGINGGIWPAPPEGRGMVSLFVEVDDVQKYATKATGLGAKVLIPPQKLRDGDEM